LGHNGLGWVVTFVIAFGGYAALGGTGPGWIAVTGRSVHTERSGTRMLGHTGRLAHTGRLVHTGQVVLDLVMRVPALPPVGGTCSPRRAACSLAAGST